MFRPKTQSHCYDRCQKFKSLCVIPTNSNTHYNASYFYIIVPVEIFVGNMRVLLVTKLNDIVVHGMSKRNLFVVRNRDIPLPFQGLN